MFAELFEKLPDGPFWPSGKWWKEFGRKLDRDRARVVQPTGSEIPSESGRWFNLTPTKSTGSTNTAPHPFEIIDSSETVDDVFVPKVTVNIDSWLRSLSKRAANKLTVTGLGASFEVEDGTLIYLKIDLENELYTIEHGDPWDGYDEPVKFTGTGESKVQTHAFAVIGYVQGVPDPNPYPDRVTMIIPASEDSPNLQIVQCMTTHQMLCRDCFDGDDVIVPVPASAPGPDV